MNLDRQRYVALAILKSAMEEGKKEEGDNFPGELKKFAQELVDTFGDEGLKLFSNDELCAFTYALAGLTPPTQTTET